MASNVRSVTVRMNADVQSYVADIRRASQETQRSMQGITAAAGAAGGAARDAQGRFIGAGQGARGIPPAVEPATRSLRTMAAQMVSTTREGERMRRGLNDIGSGAGKVGLAAAAGLTAVVLATANFDKAMSRVQAATNASADDLSELRGAAIKAGADTVFSASEAADGITELGKAGLTTGDILSGGLSGALDLAAAGQISVADAANTTATTLQQFNLSGDQASRVADVLAASANKAMGDVTDMSEALKYVGPVAAQMGLGLEDTAGAIAELAQQGILGSQAGTSLRGMLTSLTSPSKQASLTMEGLGISMYDAQGKFIGIDGIAGQLQSTMSGLTNAERDQALGRIFGNEQITAARILYAGGSDDVAKWTAAVTDSGFAAEQAATLTDNLAGDVEQLKGSLETAFIGTGSSSQGPLRTTVQNLTDITNGYSGLPGPARTAAGAALGLTAAIGGGTFVFAKAVSGLASMRGSLENMGVSAQNAARSTKILGRVGVGAAGLGLLAAGLASTNKAMATLETTAGGAALGFSVGGPWGAAIGGAIGLVVGLTHAHDDTTAAVKATAATFDVETGAITNNTRVKVAAQLQDKGYFDTLSKLGINSQLATDAVMGQTAEQEKLNAALAAADPGVLTDSLADLQAQYGDTQGQATFNQQQEAARQKVDDLKSGLEGQSSQFKQASEDAEQLAGAVSGAGTASFQTAEQVAASAKELEEARKAAQSTAEGFFNLGDSLNDSKVSLDGWIGNLEKQAQALRDFRKNAAEAADKGLRKGLIAALQDAGPEGAMRLGQLANASEAQIGRANKAWKRGQSEIAAYVDQTMKVPSSVSTTVNANANQATSVINSTIRQLARVNGYTATTYIKTVRQAAGGGKGADAVTAGPLGGAFATGGYTGRGGKYEVAGVVHRGEVVIPQERVARDWSSLKARYGDLPGFAGGGVVGSSTDDDEPDKASTKKATKSQAAARVRKAKARAKANRQANNAVQNFEIDLTIDDSGVSSAADSFADEYGNIKDRFKDANRKLSDGLVEQAKKIRAQSVAYDGLTKTLQATKDQQAALAGSAAGSVNNDIFGNGLAGLQAQLGADTGDIGSIQSALAQAVANGLDGGLFAALAGSGDVTTVSQVGQLNAAQIQALEDQFNNRVTAQNALGQFAGDTAYGAQVTRQTAAVDRMAGQIKDLQDKLPRAIERGAEAGTERGSRKGSAEGTGAGNNAANTTTTQTTKVTQRGGGHRRGKGRG